MQKENNIIFAKIAYVFIVIAIVRDLLSILALIITPIIIGILCASNLKFFGIIIGFCLILLIVMILISVFSFKSLKKINKLLKGEWQPDSLITYGVLNLLFVSFIAGILLICIDLNTENNINNFNQNQYNSDNPNDFNNNNNNKDNF